MSRLTSWGSGRDRGKGNWRRFGIEGTDPPEGTDTTGVGRVGAVGIGGGTGTFGIEGMEVVWTEGIWTGVEVGIGLGWEWTTGVDGIDTGMGLGWGIDGGWGLLIVVVWLEGTKTGLCCICGSGGKGLLSGTTIGLGTIFLVGFFSSFFFTSFVLLSDFFYVP